MLCSVIKHSRKKKCKMKPKHQMSALSDRLHFSSALISSLSDLKQNKVQGNLNFFNYEVLNSLKQSNSSCMACT